MEVEFMKKLFLMYGALALGLAGLLPGTGLAQNRPAGDIPGPIDSIQDLQDTAKMLFKMADTNNDGQISQKEAIDVGNLLVGGFFFRADANGDGVLTPEEARTARDQLFQQQPLLRYVLQKAKPNNGGTEIGNAGTQPGQPAGDVARNLAANPARTIGSLLDTNRNQRIEASELRQAVQQSVQTLFTIADTNQDSLLSPAELKRAVGEAARTAVQVAFQAADTDRNGALSQAEFDKAITEPAHAVFRVLDVNNDGQISLDELQRAQQVITQQIQRLRMPESGGSRRGQFPQGGVIGQPAQVAPAPGTVAPAPGTAPQP
jgi:Ca2+-binding EF-hand superfamily protein